MKKMLSLAAMFAALSYAAPASAALNLGGDAAVRLRSENFYGPTAGTAKKSNDVKWQYRVRLNAGADLGDGYFFKAMVTDESNHAGGWQTVDYGNAEAFQLQVSNFYFGRMLQDCNYAFGRLPLGSFNNPVFDLTLYPTQPLENPVANINMDRVYGATYGTKLGTGDLKATFVVLDNSARNNSVANNGDGMLNDGYAALLSYKVKVGSVTLEPQYLRTLTNTDIWSQTATGNGVLLNAVHSGVTPYSLGANVSVPAGSAKLSFSGFYTHCDDTTPNAAKYTFQQGTKVKYSGYQFRVKGEVGKFMAFYDYNHTTDKSNNLASDAKYTNNFVWAQYQIPVHKSAAGSFTVQPTLRYLATKADGGVTAVNQQRLRTELWATVTF
jgi:hypothetical protein